MVNVTLVMVQERRGHTVLKRWWKLNVENVMEQVSVDFVGVQGMLKNRFLLLHE